MERQQDSLVIWGLPVRIRQGLMHQEEVGINVRTASY